MTSKEVVIYEHGNACAVPRMRWEKGVQRLRCDPKVDARQNGGIKMLILKFEVDAPDGSAEWIKENIAMVIERWGDCRLVSVEEKKDQIGMEWANT